MCSRSPLLLLLLLCALAFVEVSSWPTPRLPLIEDHIDLAKCVATRKWNNQYKCFLRSQAPELKCINDDSYVQEKNTTLRLPPPSFDSESCLFGITIRPLTMSAWEFEVLIYESNQKLILELCSVNGGSFFVEVKLKFKENDYNKTDETQAANYDLIIQEVVKDGEKTFKDAPPNYVKQFVDNFRDPNIVKPYNAAQFNRAETRIQYYIRFRLFRGSADKKFTDYSRIVATIYVMDGKKVVQPYPVATAGLTSCSTQPCEIIGLHTCSQMMKMVHRKKSVSGWDKNYLTKIPREAFHHNVNDFAQMCTHLPRYNQPDQVFYTYHVETKLEIVAIECLPERENDHSAPRLPYSILRAVNGTLIQYNNFTNKYRDAKKANYQLVEVTCRTKEDICFYCGEPEWNKDTASIPSGMTPMVYTPGKPGGCATLTCPPDSLPYYPHIRFTSLEPPQCEHNAEKDEFEWTFSYQPTTQWARVRRPLERGYCRKKSNCPPFTETMLACPETTDHMPWFKGCVPVNRTDYSDYEVAPGYWCANKTKQFYFAFSRRIVQKPAIGVTCNENTGLYEVYLPDGEIQTGFTEESWIVCRDKPVHKVDKYWYFELDKYMKIAVGTIVGILLPVLLSSLFVAGYVPIKKILKKQKEETLQPEQIKAQAMEAEMAQKAVARKKAKDTLEYRDTDADYLKAVAAREEAAKRMKEMQFVEIDHNEDMRTCRLPTRSEQEMLDEIERQAKCTDEEDQTGREVKPIAREDEPEREEPDRRR